MLMYTRCNNVGNKLLISFTAFLFDAGWVSINYLNFQSLQQFRERIHMSSLSSYISPLTEANIDIEYLMRDGNFTCGDKFSVDIQKYLCM